MYFNIYFDVCIYWCLLDQCVFHSVRKGLLVYFQSKHPFLLGKGMFTYLQRFLQVALAVHFAPVSFLKAESLEFMMCRIHQVLVLYLIVWIIRWICICEIDLQRNLSMCVLVKRRACLCRLYVQLFLWNIWGEKICVYCTIKSSFM